jgi:hypothetical protein
MGHAIRCEQSAADLRRRSARYRRLAALYAGEVAATMLAEADNLEVAADALEDRNTFLDRLRPPPTTHAIAARRG